MCLPPFGHSPLGPITAEPSPISASVRTRRRRPALPAIALDSESSAQVGERSPADALDVLTWTKKKMRHVLEVLKQNEKIYDKVGIQHKDL